MKVDEVLLHSIIGHGIHQHGAGAETSDSPLAQLPARGLQACYWEEGLRLPSRLTAYFVNQRRRHQTATLLDTLLSSQGIACVGKELHEELFSNLAALAARRKEEWFNNHARTVSAPTTTVKSLQSGSGLKAVMECDFIALMQKMTDLPEHELLDLVDLLDKDSIGAVGLKELFIVVAILSARDRTERLKVLYLLGQDLYELMTGPCPLITETVWSACQHPGNRRGWQAIRLWGLLFEVKDTLLWEARVQFEVPLGSILSFKDFQVLLYAAISGAVSTSSERRNSHSPLQGIGSSSVGSSYKTKSKLSQSTAASSRSPVPASPSILSESPCVIQ